MLWRLLHFCLNIFILDLILDSFPSNIFIASLKFLSLQAICTLKYLAVIQSQILLYVLGMIGTKEAQVFCSCIMFILPIGFLWIGPKNNWGCSG